MQPRMFLCHWQRTAASMGIEGVVTTVVVEWSACANDSARVRSEGSEVEIRAYDWLPYF